MTTDRPTASPRTATLTQRAAVAPAAGRQPAAPTDAFSALLGAAGPRPDDAPRADQTRPRRDDNAAKPKPADGKPAATDEQPKVGATEPTAEEPTETAPRLVTPDIFALQLASPLPTTPTPVTAPGAAPTPAEGEGQAGLPAFTPANLALTGQLPAAPALPAPGTDVPATPAGAEAAAPNATQPPQPPPTTGGIPLLVLAGLTPASETDVPKIDLPASAAALATPPTAAATDATATPQPADAAVLPNASKQQTSSDSQPQQNPQSAPAPTQQAKPADAPAPTTAQPLTPAAPVAQAAPITPTVAVERAVPLYRAPETAAALIKIAADRGITHAKLNLKPAELGGIEVRLQTTPHGVSAQLVAETAEAAKLLTQAAADLRRDLADRNVNLLSLDVSTQQQYQEQQAGSTQADIFGDDYQPGGTHALRFGPQGDAGLTEPAAPADTSLVLPNGVLVDVLA